MELAEWALAEWTLAEWTLAEWTVAIDPGWEPRAMAAAGGRAAKTWGCA